MSNFVTCATSLSPVANLPQYLNAVFNFPELSLEEERELARRLREHNDSQAAWRLVTSHLRYVVYISRSYLGYGLPQEELIQEGNIGLMEAVKRFDPEQGVPLRAYANYSIRYYIHEFIIRNWRIVKVATTKARRKLFFKLRSTRKRLGWLNHKEAAEIAQNLEVELSDVNHMEAGMCLRDESFDPVALADGESPAPVEYLEDANNPEMLNESLDFRLKAQRAIETSLSQLNERSQRILRARWLGDKKVTLEALAREFGISTERVRQLERAALDKLRQSVQREMSPPRLSE